LAGGKAPPEIDELARGLAPLPAVLLESARHAVKNEWREVALADSALARIGWTDAWYPEAAELRANWRLRVSNPEERRRYADEALQMLDRLAGTVSLYGLRTRAGLAADRPDIVLESLSNYARLALGMMRAGLQTPDASREETAALVDVLDGIAGKPGVDAVRVAEVRAEIAQLRAP
jgi:hypothetical protein